MSLAKLVLRSLTVLALIDKTLAGRSVTSSNLSPIGDLPQGDDAQLPVIAVYTDQSRANAVDLIGLDLLGANHTITLALEIAVYVEPPKKDGQENEIVGIPETDEGFELTIDLIERRALAELQAGTSIWADLWRRIAIKAVSINSERGAAVEKGVKFAARRIEIGIETLMDPPPGRPLEGAWDAAVSAIEADSRTATMGALIRRVAENNSVESWQAIMGQMGLTRAGAAAIAIGPVVAAVSNAADDKDLGQTITVGAGGATIQTGDGSPEPLIEAAP